MEKSKFVYLNRKDYFTIEFGEFDKNYVKDKSSKFVQLYINKESFIVVGNGLYHKDILKFQNELVEATMFTGTS